ncbi:hypothetical protein BRC84_04215 [Halobacteriales archaeon QS_1_68_44]|nr:MAG: hypothetical protein BRC84_04215 [Halobacteriales archaeon QS_1_68_44]
MATSTRTDGVGRGLLETWHTGVGIGIAGVIPMILLSTVVGGQDLFPLFGLIPYAVVWGLLYAGLASIDRIRRLAADPRTGAPMGVAYGFLVWWGPQIGKPFGEYVSVNGAMQAAVFGLVVGFLYAYSVTGSGGSEASVLAAGEQSG